VRGWINFYLKGVVDVETILEVLWKKGPMSLLVKMWMDFFDAKMYKVVNTNVFVKMSRLLLDFWSLDILKEIRNVIGVFYQG
jgi:hypothetical protein